jgi:hypothetical protein
MAYRELYLGPLGPCKVSPIQGNYESLLGKWNEGVSLKTMKYRLNQRGRAQGMAEWTDEEGNVVFTAFYMDGDLDRIQRKITDKCSTCNGDLEEARIFIIGIFKGVRRLPCSHCDKVAKAAKAAAREAATTASSIAFEAANKANHLADALDDAFDEVYKAHKAGNKTEYVAAEKAAMLLIEPALGAAEDAAVASEAAFAAAEAVFDPIEIRTFVAVTLNDTTNEAARAANAAAFVVRDAVERFKEFQKFWNSNETNP